MFLFEDTDIQLTLVNAKIFACQFASMPKKKEEIIKKVVDANNPTLTNSVFDELRMYNKKEADDFMMGVYLALTRLGMKAKQGE